MAFSDQVLRVSELIADAITGAVVQTAAAGARATLQTLAGVPALRFYSNALPDPGRIGLTGDGIGGGGLAFVAPDGADMSLDSVDGLTVPALSLESGGPIIFQGSPGGVQFPGGILTDMAGDSTLNLVANASGRASTDHDLGVVPDLVLVTSFQANRQVALVGRDATTLTMEARTAAGALLTSGQTFDVCWLAVVITPPSPH